MLYNPGMPESKRKQSRPVVQLSASASRESRKARDRDASAMEGATAQFRRRLLAWYDAHARDLPWRRSRDPYAIWVSEIMLQQTRVAAVLEYYDRFMSTFPSIPVLALAREEEVLSRWSGLGYYRRARQLHSAAQFIVREWQGRLPQTAGELRKLPGVGEYTSAAIASIAFGEATAAIDGNVQRVIERLFRQPATAGPAWMRDQAQTLIDRDRPGDFNQAMMELGATVCLPQKPLCLACPVHAHCSTRGEYRPRKPRKMHSREITYALLSGKRSGVIRILLEQRPPSAAQMPGMWELPELLQQDALPEAGRLALTLRHSITVTNFSVRVVQLQYRKGQEQKRLIAPKGSRRWFAGPELDRLPLTGLARKILQRVEVMPSPLEIDRHG